MDLEKDPLTLQAEATRRTWQTAALALLFAFCCLTRLLHLGDKAIMHDEGLFVYYMHFQMYKEWFYNYLPILHGPAMLHLQTLTFHLFGVTDFTMRLGCALLGIAGFFWIWKLKPWLGTVGVWVALVFYTVAPGITYYQRFFRNDALYMFNALWIITSLAYWWRTRKGAWGASAIAGCTVLFTNKESSLFIYFSVVTFFLLLVIHDLARHALEGRETRVAEERLTAPPPRAAFIAAGLFLVVTFCLTQIFEGIRYDADVVKAIGHDWVLRDVRSIPLALGWQTLTPQQAPDAGGLSYGSFWRAFYAGLFLGSLLVGIVFSQAVRLRLGARVFVADFWQRIYEGRWHLLGAIGLSVILYLGVFTSWFKHEIGFFEIYAKTWSYWGGQHEWGRIGGPFRQHLLNILLYEFPALLIVAIAWIGGLFTARWSRTGGVAFFLLMVPVAAFHKLIFSDIWMRGANGLETLVQIDWLKMMLPVLFIAGLLVALAPRLGRVVSPLLFVGLIGWSTAVLTSPMWDTVLRSRLYRDGEPIKLSNRHVDLLSYMEIQFNFDGGTSLLIVLILTFFATVYAWLAIGRGERFKGFLVWWTVTSTGAACYAREAVPQVGMHAMLPLILLAAVTVEGWWQRVQRPGPRGMMVAALAILALWNVKNTFMLNIKYPDDIRERMVYGHHPDWMKAHFDFVQDYAEIAPVAMRNNQARFLTEYNNKAVHKDLRVAVQPDGVIWPARWYFRDIDWSEEKNVDRILSGDYAFIFITPRDARDHPAFAEKYHLFRSSDIRFWLPQPVDADRLFRFWTLLVPGHRQDTDVTTQADATKSEWYKLYRYAMWRDVFSGGDNRFGGMSGGADYVFGIRKDLY